MTQADPTLGDTSAAPQAWHAMTGDEVNDAPAIGASC